MSWNKPQSSPENEQALLHRCQQLEGLTVAQLAAMCEVVLPSDPIQRKGFVGLLVERALGSSAGNQPIPDFEQLGIELKTIPLNAEQKPIESTFVTSISLLTIHQQTWKTSSCYLKLKRVLWMPIESSDDIPFHYRRFGRAILWSPTVEQEAILEQDWLLLSGMLGMGRLTEVDARMGEYLQVRPKAAHGGVLCDGLDETGQRIKTLPRGFYLRSRFTAIII